MRLDTECSEVLEAALDHCRSSCTAYKAVITRSFGPCTGGCWKGPAGAASPPSGRPCRQRLLSKLRLDISYMKVACSANQDATPYEEPCEFLPSSWVSAQEFHTDPALQTAALFDSPFPARVSRLGICGATMRRACASKLSGNLTGAIASVLGRLQSGAKCFPVRRSDRSVILLLLPSSSSYFFRPPHASSWLTSNAAPDDTRSAGGTNRRRVQR